MEQPKNSKIKISKTDDTLEIYIPPARFRCYLTTVILGMELILSFPILLMAYGVYTAEFPYKVVCAAFSLPFLAGAIGMGSMLPSLFFSSTRLLFNSQQINMNFDRKIFGSKSEVISREDITEFRRIKRHTVIKNPNTKYAGAIEELPDIVFQVGDKKYKLGSYTHADLPEAELDWLAFEISNFWELDSSYKIVNFG